MLAGRVPHAPLRLRRHAPARPEPLISVDRRQHERLAARATPLGGNLGDLAQHMDAGLAAASSSTAFHSVATSLSPHFGSHGAAEAAKGLLSGFHHTTVDAATSTPLLSISSVDTASLLSQGALSVNLNMLDASAISVLTHMDVISSGIMDKFSWLSSVDPNVMPMLQSAFDELGQAVALGVGASASSPGQLATPGLHSLASTTAALQSIMQTPLVGGQLSMSAQMAALTSMAANLRNSGELSTLAIVAASLLASIAASDPGPAFKGAPVPCDADLLRSKYSAKQLEQYFKLRPVMVGRRAAEVAAECIRIGAALLSDQLLNKTQENEALRASQVRSAIERLGPAYVKVGQALSTRSDLLPAAYFDQIQLLQDRVQPFPCDVALHIIEDRFGRPLNQIFSTISDKPVAAASLGQVYRAKLLKELGGHEVAVKVQRPGVLAHLSLDLYLMRKLAVALGGDGPSSTDGTSIIDEWGDHFLQELDYCVEAKFASELARDMAQLPGIVIVDVLPQLSCGDIITTLWVEGTKLGESDAEDVRTLCTTLLNAYLVQLLETGLLHADPHPGNLLRTADGRICILDYGLLTRVTEEQRWSLIEFITHLVTLNWVAVAADMQMLGFIPIGYDINSSGMVDPLAKIMKALVGGGGGNKINVKELMNELNDLSRKYPFKIPPFFLNIIRTFTVLEGITLRVDPNYAMIQECLPYLSRRLMTDPHPRAQKCLRDLLYGDRQRLNVRRLAKMSNAFSNYSTNALTPSGRARPVTSAASYASPFSPTSATSAAAAPLSSPTTDISSSTADITSAIPFPMPTFATAAFSSFSGMIGTTGTVVVGAANVVGGLVPALSIVAMGPPSHEPPLIHPAVKEGLTVVLSPTASYVQEMLVEELVAAVDVVSREALSGVLHGISVSMPVQLASALMNSVGPLPPSISSASPVTLLDRLSSTVALSDEDKEALGVVRDILLLMESVPPIQVDGKTLPHVATAISELLPLGPAVGPGLLHMGDMFFRAFIRRAALRIAEGLKDEAAKSEYDAAMSAVH